METPDYVQSSACALGLMETRAQALRKSVIPAKAGIHFDPKALDSRFRGNDGRKESIYPSFVRNQVESCMETCSRFRTMLVVGVGEVPAGPFRGAGS